MNRYIKFMVSGLAGLLFLAMLIGIPGGALATMSGTCTLVEGWSAACSTVCYTPTMEFFQCNTSCNFSGRTIHMLLPSALDDSIDFHLNGHDTTLYQGSDGWYTLTLPDTTGNYWCSGFMVTPAGLWTPQYGLDGLTTGTATYFSSDIFEDGDDTLATEVWIISGILSPYTPVVSTIRPHILNVMNPEEWILGSPKIVSGSDTAQFMRVKSDTCGWFTHYFLGNPPYSFYFINSQDSTTMGSGGYDDASPWALDSTGFNSDYTIWLEPDELSGTGYGLFSTSYPETEGTCTYELAAFVRDFDASHPDFFNSGETQTNCESDLENGLVRGIVDSILGSDRKPTQASSGLCFSRFSDLFNDVDEYNTDTCVDLVMSKSSDGLWEFDAYNEPSKNYLPIDSLNSTHNVLAASCVATPSASLTDDALADTVTSSDYSWNTDVTKSPNGYHNFNFCFETHATFKYQVGQVFSFRGDDDVWVFINNKLAIDLGGLHVPLPGKVDLDTLGLTAGSTYNFDFFFCERMPCGSNVRIKTSIYFDQKKSLYYDLVDGVYYLSKIEGGGGSCSAIETGETQDTLTGSELSGLLTYTLRNSKDSVLDTLESGTSYGGITINTSNGTITIDSTKISGLAPGRYRLVITETSNSTVRAVIYIKVAGNTAFWSVNGDTAKIDDTPAVDTLAGRLVPFQIAKKSGDYIDSSDASFILSFSDGLLVYEDSLGTTAVASLQTLSTGDDGIITLWATGTRSALADTTYEITLKGSKSDPISLRFHLPRLSFVSDVVTEGDSLVSWTYLGDPKPSLDTSILYLGTGYPTYLVAYDSVTGELCRDCDDALTATTSDSLSFSSVSGGTSLALSNGWTIVMVTGTGKDTLTGASFVVTGPSPVMVDDWTGINMIPPPVPLISWAAMYDVDNNGYADSLYIRFDRPIVSGDSAPDFLVVRWPLTDPDTVILRGKSAMDSTKTLLYPRLDSLVDTAGTENRLATLTSGDGYAVSMPYSTSELNTQSVGRVDAWFTFTDSSGNRQQRPSTGSILDSMGPVLESARIVLGSSGYDQLTLTLSEDVTASDSAMFIGAGMQRTPFQFKMFADSLVPTVITPASITWSQAYEVGASGDSLTRSIAKLLFSTEATLLPRSGDSVRISLELCPDILAGSCADSLQFALHDTLGNVRGDLNPYVVIQGEKHKEVTSVSYAQDVDFSQQDTATTYVDKVSIYADDDSVAAELQEAHGAILGSIIKIDLSEIYSNYKDSISSITDSDVVLHYVESFHTNLGTYVAGAKGTVSCADTAVFGSGGCTGSGNGYVFLGWNMRTDKGVGVGTGAYIARLHVWVEVVNIRSKVSGSNISRDRIWGVRRAGSGTKISK
ncbi:MAG TPA: fibro-slime domain-containing protein [Fibrobacteraceae bacterium]|nr:fibro-slime domain-containing protein [Fibrobacteraceae bacterium]